MKLPKMSVPLFDCGEIYFCQTEEELAFLCRQVNAETPDVAYINGLSALYFHNRTNCRIFLIGVFNGEISTLAHEIAHCVFKICGVVNVKVKQGESNETFCYLVSNIMEFALKHLRKGA